MKLILISDTHCQHDKVILPPGDVLIHAGDFCGYGNRREIAKFNEWLVKQDFSHVVVVAGNHDRKFEEEPERSRRALSSHTEGGGQIHYLQDTYWKIEGLKFYGSPWQPKFCDWAFNLPRRGEELRSRWAAIPDDTDVLITHSPPHGILDKSHHSPWENIGCELLLNRVLKIKPKLHVFGHCHAGYGMNHRLVKETVFVNASICNEAYDPINQPVEIEI